MSRAASESPGLRRRAVLARITAAARTAVVFSVAMIVIAPSPALASNDEYFDGQWALAQVGAPAAWTRSTGTGVTIGIVDTGVDIDHPDLASKIDATASCLGSAGSAWSCVEGAGRDDNGHGTIVSGIAAAVVGNGRGVAGAAPDARLVVAKSLDANGTGSADDIRAGVEWVLNRGARVVNLSLGDEDSAASLVLGTPLKSAIELAWSRGAVPVLAAGNANTCSGAATRSYAGLNALVVGATDRSGGVACYSSSPGTAKWGLVAPGGSATGASADNVFSTGLNGSYVSAAGTSMAAPHVSAAIALLLAQGLGPPDAVARLMGTLDAVPCGDGCQGRLNMAAAVGADPNASGSGRTPSPTTPSPASPRPSVARPTSSTTTVAKPTTTSTTAPAPPTTQTPSTVPAIASSGPVEMAAPPDGLSATRPREIGSSSTLRLAVPPAAMILLVGVGAWWIATALRARLRRQA